MENQKFEPSEELQTWKRLEEEVKALEKNQEQMQHQLCVAVPVGTHCVRSATPDEFGEILGNVDRIGTLKRKRAEAWLAYLRSSSIPNN